MKKNGRKILYKNTEYNNVREIIDDATRKYADCNAFTIKNKNGKEVSYRNITYKEFGEEINAFGTALVDMGLKGKRIAIIGKNRYEWILGYITTLNGVGIAVPLDKGLPEQEIILSLQRSQADAIIFEESYADTIQKIKQENQTQIKTFISMDNETQYNFITINSLIEKGKELLDQGNREYLDATIDNDAMSIILFTSGTTSLAKAVMLSHRNIASNISAMNAMIEFKNTDVNIAFLPFHHTFGSTCIIMMLCSGVKNVFCDGLRHIQENLKEYKVSVFVAVPLILEAMHKKIMQTVVKQGKEKIVEKGKKISSALLKVGIDVRRKLFKEIIDNLGGSLRFVISGAAAINKKVAEDFNAFGITTIQGYGLTETSPVLCGEFYKHREFGSVGVPLYNVDVKIDEPNSNGIGEIIAKGPNVMLGYYNNEEETNAVLKDGWFHTGDLGYIGKHKYLFITGRKKDVIVLKNGKNVYPEELEVLISELPYVEECMVFGYPKDDDLIVSCKIVYNKEYVKEKYADIKAEDFEKIVWEDIKKINSTLTNYKHIKKIIVTDEPMIKTTTAKIKRFEEMKKIK
ncbi:MAG: long-chain fatty acid--CoA ligase [Clostridia bacterium]|nr:long-chain fatty acid--CoA ligase [Clostridia bacterium]